LPQGVFSDLCYLKTLKLTESAAIAWCWDTQDINKVEDYVLAYLCRSNKHLWDVTDMEHYVLMDLAWKGDKLIENFVGCMYIRHPKERLVDYFLTKYGVPSTISSQQCCISPQINGNVIIVEDLPINNVSTSALCNESTWNLVIAIPAEETNNENPKSLNVRDQRAKNQPSNKQPP
jgi:hypothetical protein